MICTFLNHQSVLFSFRIYRIEANKIPYKTTGETVFSYLLNFFLLNKDLPDTALEAEDFVVKLSGFGNDAQSNQVYGCVAECLLYKNMAKFLVRFRKGN